MNDAICVCMCPLEIGVGVMGFGLFFLLFGVLLYFDSVLLAFGNVSDIQDTRVLGVMQTSHIHVNQN